MSTVVDANLYENERYPGLAKLDYARRWLDGFISLFEAFLVSFSSILLTIGIGVSMFDFFTGGQALKDPVLMNGWAVIQTLAVDTQFLVMWNKCKQAIDSRSWFSAIGYALLGVALGFVVFATNAIPSLQLAKDITFDNAVLQLHLDSTTIVYVRSVVLVILAIIAAFNRTVIRFDVGSGRTQKEQITKQEKSVVQKVKRKFSIKEKWYQFRLSRINKKIAEVDKDIDAKNTQENIPDKAEEENLVMVQKPRITQPLPEKTLTEERSTEPLNILKRSAKKVSRRVLHTPVKKGDGVEKVKQMLTEKPSVKNAEICRATGLSASRVSTIRTSLRTFTEVS